MQLTNAKTKKIATLAVALVAVLGLMASSCDTTESEASSDERKTQREGYEGLTDRQPAKSMSYSPSRNTIIRWIETWDEPGQLNFTYLLNNAGEAVGYFVFVGPPVSYCAMLTPNYSVSRHQHGNLVLPEPGVDGVYYSGGQCVQYYGIDATTDQLIEFTVGGSLNYMSSTQPLDLEVPALGPTETEDLQPNAEGEYFAEDQ